MDEHDTDLTSSRGMARPLEIADALVKKLMQNLYGMKVISIAEFSSYLDRNYYVTVENTCDNSHVTSMSEDGYVLKILNSTESKDPDFINGRNRLALHVHEHGIKTPRPVLNIHGELNSLEKLYNTTEERYIVRLFEYVPGKLLTEVPYTTDLLFEVGKLAGELDKACQDFNCPAFEKHKAYWSLTDFSRTVRYIDAINDPSQRQLVEDIICTCNRDVLPNFSQFQKGVIHADINADNILIKPTQNKDTPYDVIGILDFGDSELSYYIIEIATLLTHIMLSSSVLDPFEAGGHTLAGFLSVFSLQLQDLKFLKEFIAAALAHVLVIAIHSAKMDPENSEYLLHFVGRGWDVLKLLWMKPKRELYYIFNNCISKYDIKIDSLPAAEN